jgi:uncharacterized protein YndB with AHSA1/START domain
MKHTGRRATITLDIDAPAADVWRALTEAHEMVRWFPPHATVEPGVGGRIEWRWNDAFTMIGRIDAWDPERRLVLVQEREQPHAADGSAVPDTTPAHLLMEFAIETQQGRTRLTLVHSGFGDGADWDDELEGVANGWEFELRSLVHYLESHGGRDRYTGWANTTVAAPELQVWTALTGANGLRLFESARVPGNEYELVLPTGNTLTGTTRRSVPQREWFGVVRELDNGLMRLHTWRGGGRTGVSVWFATWNDRHAERVAELEASARIVLENLMR